MIAADSRLTVLFAPHRPIRDSRDHKEMQTPEGLKIVPNTHQEIIALLTSDELAAVESPIAESCRFNVLRDLDATTTSYVHAEVSVSGMTVPEIVRYLVDHRKPLIEFGARFLGDEAATDDEQECDEGEDPDLGSDTESLGYGVGFGVTYAIYHNFLANRPAADFRVYLKSRRIPKHTKFAKELARVFAGSRGTRDEEA